MLNKIRRTASDFPDMLAREVPIQFSILAELTNGQDWGKETSKPREPLLPPTVRNPHAFLHLQKWSKAHFEVPEDQLLQGSLQ